MLFMVCTLWSSPCFIHVLKVYPTLEKPRSFLTPTLPGQYCFLRRLGIGKFGAFLEEHCVIITIIIIITITITIILSTPKVWSVRVTCKPHVDLVNKLSGAWSDGLGWPFFCLSQEENCTGSCLTCFFLFRKSIFTRWIMPYTLAGVRDDWLPRLFTMAQTLSPKCS